MAKNNITNNTPTEEIQKEIQEESFDDNQISKKLKLLEEKEQKINEALESLDEKLKSLDLKQKEVTDTMEFFSKTKEYSSEELKSDSINTGKELAKQEKVTIIIPRSELNPNDICVPVTINGYTYNILRGKRVEVPLEVAKILEESKYI